MITLENDIDAPIIGAFLKNIGVSEQHLTTATGALYTGVGAGLFFAFGLPGLISWIGLYLIGSQDVKHTAKESMGQSALMSTEDRMSLLFNGAPVQQEIVSHSQEIEAEPIVQVVDQTPSSPVAEILQYLDQDTTNMLQAESVNAGTGTLAELTEFQRSQPEDGIAGVPNSGPNSDAPTLNPDMARLLAKTYTPTSAPILAEFNAFIEWLDLGEAPWGAALNSKSTELLQLVWGVKAGNSKPTKLAKSKRDFFLEISDLPMAEVRIKIKLVSWNSETGILKPVD
ncbi:MAG: hypothetical protein AAGA83_00435 [Cyanobacteria bacterium P01_F01_bin.116]